MERAKAAGYRVEVGLASNGESYAKPRADLVYVMLAHSGRTAICSFLFYRTRTQDGSIDFAIANGNRLQRVLLEHSSTGLLPQRRPQLRI